MTTITDEYMKEMMTKTKAYCIVLLKPGPSANNYPDVRKLIWEHGRRNFALRADGQLSIVAPVTAETGLSGLGIFDCNEEETRKLMDSDPGVVAGIFIYEVHPCRSFPGDRLPA